MDPTSRKAPRMEQDETSWLPLPLITCRSSSTSPERKLPHDCESAPDTSTEKPQADASRQSASDGESATWSKIWTSTPASTELAAARTRPPAEPPQIPGVYRLYDDAGELLYVGGTGNVHNRLKRRSLTDQPWLAMARYATWVTQPDRETALLAEWLEITARPGPHNKANRAPGASAERVEPRPTLDADPDGWAMVSFNRRPELDKNARPAPRWMNRPLATSRGDLTAEGVAVALRASPEAVRRLAEAGKMPGWKEDGQWCFRRSEVYAALEAGRLAA